MAGPPRPAGTKGKTKKPSSSKGVFPLERRGPLYKTRTARGTTLIAAPKGGRSAWSAFFGKSANHSPANGGAPAAPTRPLLTEGHSARLLEGQYTKAAALPCTSRQLSWRLQSGTTSVHRFDSHDYSPAVFSFQQFSENFHGRCLFPALDWTGFRILFHQPEEPHLQTSTICLTPENRFFCSGVR